MLLKQNDQYMEKLNQYNFDLFEIKDKSDYISKIENCTLDFSKKQKQRIHYLISEFNKKIAEIFPVNKSFKEPLDVNFIKSDGSECGLAYTRLNYIVFTDRMFNFDAYIIHELFHVVSRQNIELKKRLYETFGFHESDTDLLDLHQIQYILNPDAPINNYYLCLDGFKIIPYAENLQLKYNFLILDKSNNIADLPERTRKLYCNRFKKQFEPITYIIHPEEIVAEVWTAFWVKKLNLKSTVSNHNLEYDHPLVVKMKNILEYFEIRS